MSTWMGKEVKDLDNTSLLGACKAVEDVWQEYQTKMANLAQRTDTRAEQLKKMNVPPAPAFIQLREDLTAERARRGL